MNMEIPDGAVAAYVTELEEELTEENFEALINERILTSQNLINKDGYVRPEFMVITPKELYVIQAPQDKNEFKMLVNSVFSGFSDIRAIIYIDEVWTLSVGQEENQYLDSPELIVDNPMKDEGISIYANGYGAEYLYHMGFDRDDSGKIRLRNLEEVDGHSNLICDEVVCFLQDAMERDRQ
jgi:hypothetical protein